MKFIAFAIPLSLATTVQVPAGDRTPYANVRYNYWIDLPEDFSAIVESANGDGGTSQSVDGQAKLAVWGSYPSEGGFAQEVKWRIGQEETAGWSVDYVRRKPKWAVWSGSKGDRVYYERAIPVCGGAVAYFRLEYDKARAKAFDPVITRLVKSLRSGDC
ncbi:hypothetical protein [Mesorhizobium retamae]|uniref:Uncharacterized protein n=1 Tax=Mesorhizobium retamae TaxID=2912854 RepID=A0ABS9QNJ5_9HYPH|nr:hypothetical protein [Mesorhizobium sp. IRAMC:0171]MCG7509004.1 hypothetical protein [Mesorhizobium sp. IRAMC:0171]